MTKWVVLTEDRPGELAVAGVYETDTGEEALDRAALDRAASDLFHVLELGDAQPQRVAARTTVVEWEAS